MYVYPTHIHIYMYRYIYMIIYIHYITLHCITLHYIHTMHESMIHQMIGMASHHATCSTGAPRAQWTLQTLLAGRCGLRKPARALVGHQRFGDPKMGVSINGGPPKLLVYNGKSYSNGWFRGTPISGHELIQVMKHDEWLNCFFPVDIGLLKPRECENLTFFLAFGTGSGNRSMARADHPWTEVPGDAWQKKCESFSESEAFQHLSTSN